jgi:hypothetical protein
MQQKCRMQILYNVFPQILSRLLYTYLCTPLGADEVNGWSLQLINLFMMKVMIWGFVWVTFIRLWLWSTWLLSSYLLWHPSLQLQGNLCVVLAGFHFVCKIDSYVIVNLLSNMQWSEICIVALDFAELQMRIVGKCPYCTHPKLLDFCRQPKYLEHTRFHWLK